MFVSMKLLYYNTLALGIIQVNFIKLA